MSLQGSAAVAMWWDIAPDWKAEFEDWHSHEHLPERLGIPGFARGSRWAAADGGTGYFVLYELTGYAVLSSAHYLARLNQPTPWSTRMMPQHRNMVRSLCTVATSHGGGLAGAMLTLRLSPRPGAEAALQQHLDLLLRRLATQRGVTGGHLLQTRAPAIEGLTQEQKIRGGRDPEADWIVLLSGYDAAALQAIGADALAPDSLAAAGTAATPGAPVTASYRLCHAMTPPDV